MIRLASLAVVACAIVALPALADSGAPLSKTTGGVMLIVIAVVCIVMLFCGRNRPDAPWQREERNWLKRDQEDTDDRP